MLSSLSSVSSSLSSLHSRFPFSSSVISSFSPSDLNEALKEVEQLTDKLQTIESTLISSSSPSSHVSTCSLAEFVSLSQELFEFRSSLVSTLSLAQVDSDSHSTLNFPAFESQYFDYFTSIFSSELTSLQESFQPNSSSFLPLLGHSLRNSIIQMGEFQNDWELHRGIKTKLEWNLIKQKANNGEEKQDKEKTKEENQRDKKMREKEEEIGEKSKKKRKERIN
jgi:hypothetical protein